MADASMHLQSHRSSRHGVCQTGLPALRRCDSAAAGNCSLPAGITKPPTWTQMAPGVCALHYLKRLDKGFSASPRLNGERNASAPSLAYWTGAHAQCAMPALSAMYGLRVLMWRPEQHTLRAVNEDCMLKSMACAMVCASSE